MPWPWYPGVDGNPLSSTWGRRDGQRCSSAPSGCSTPTPTTSDASAPSTKTAKGWRDESSLDFSSTAETGSEKPRCSGAILICFSRARTCGTASSSSSSRKLDRHRPPRAHGGRLRGTSGSAADSARNCRSADAILLGTCDPLRRDSDSDERRVPPASLYVETFNAPPWNESWDVSDAHRRLGDFLATPGAHGVADRSGRPVGWFCARACGALRS